LGIIPAKILGTGFANGQVVIRKMEKTHFVMLDPTETGIKRISGE
jgi:hypothetical protein